VYCGLYFLLPYGNIYIRRCRSRDRQGIGRSFTFLILVSHLINLYLPQSRPFTPVHLMQKVKKFSVQFLHQNRDRSVFTVYKGFMSLLALSCMSLYLIRITHSVLRLLITFEVLSIIGATVLVLGILSGALQVFICVAVLTAVVGLTIWVCNN